LEGLLGCGDWFGLIACGASGRRIESKQGAEGGVFVVAVEVG